MNHIFSLDYAIFWSSLLTVLVLSYKSNAILTESNQLHCTHIQCPTTCPEDSYLKTIEDDEDGDFEDYADDLIIRDTYIEDMGHLAELPPEFEIEDTHSPQHHLRERQKREAFFQEDIENCCENQKCVCNKCSDIPKCAEGYVAVEIVEGQGVPGNCCSIFRCVKKETCRLGVKISWWTGKCTKCSCFGENELCMQTCPEEEILQNCFSEYLQRPILNGAFWKEGSCTSCTCEQGNRRCLTPVCPKLDCNKTLRYEDECCPKCLDDATDPTPQFGHNKETDAEDIEDNLFVESTTLDSSNKSITEENSFNVIQYHSSSPASIENSLNFTETISPLIETLKSSTTSSVSMETTFSASSPTSVLPFETNSSVIETSSSTPLPSTLLSSTYTSYLEISSASSTSTEQPQPVEQLEYDSSTTAKTTTTEDPKTRKEIGLFSPTTVTSTAEANFVEIYKQVTSTAAAEASSTTPSRETPEEIKIEDTTIQLNPEDNTATPTSRIELSSEAKASTSSPTVFPTTDTGMNVSSTTNGYIPGERDDAFLTIELNGSSSEFPTSATSQASKLKEVDTTESISSTTGSTASTMGYTTSTPSDSTSHILSSSSTDFSTTLTTKTTSSPLSSTSYSTKISDAEISTTSASTTNAPEPLRPLFQSYGHLNGGDARTTNTQNQMRLVFDEIDYVVMIALFIGSLLCISLGLIIRHIKNRKKMYSSIPNSETSLSQTSTNTVLTV